MSSPHHLSSRKVRIAVVQLECHPAFAIDTQDWLGEPFVVEHGLPCLARLEANRFDIDDLLSECRTRYLNWAEVRLRSILRWLRDRFTIDDKSDLPEILVFPEGGIPRQHLTLLQDFARDTKCVVFAGTHAFETGVEALAAYKELLITPQDFVTRDNESETLETPEQELLRIAALDMSCKTVLPIIDPNTSSSKKIIKFRAKTSLSPFEYTNVLGGSIGKIGRPKVIPICLRERASGEIFTIRILPLVCSEALQLALPEEQYDLAVICSYSKSIEPFEPIIRYLSSNQIPVIFANDGRYGFSSVTVPLDRRNSSWWFGEPHAGRLPKGDAILVVDITLGANAPAMGVNNPPEHAQLVALAAVVRADSRLAAFQVSQRLTAIRRKMIRGFDSWIRVEQKRTKLAQEIKDDREVLLPLLLDQRRPRKDGEPAAIKVTTNFSNDLCFDDIITRIFIQARELREEWEVVTCRPEELDCLPDLNAFFDNINSLQVDWNNETNCPKDDFNLWTSAFNKIDREVDKLLDVLHILFNEVLSASFGDSRDLEAELTDLTERLSPTPIQQLNLWHLLQLVRLPRNAYTSQWLVHAWDCVTDAVLEGAQDDQRRSEQIPRDPTNLEQFPTLRALEAASAQQTYYRCSHLLDEPVREPGLAQVLVEVQEACREVTANIAPVSVSRHVLATLARFKREAREKAIERLTRLLGTLVERFRATSGWIFQVFPHPQDGHQSGSTLSAVVSHNTSKRYRSVPKDRGITSHVLLTRRGYLNNHVVDEFGSTSDPYYSLFMQTSKSDIAVPVFPTPGSETTNKGARPARLNDPRSMAPIAVLNLESNQFGAFLPVHVGELQATVCQLVPDLLILQATDDDTTHAAWHPEAHGWGTARLLDQFCYAVATATPGGHGAPGLTCTLWNYDEYKSVLYARGTLGFDYEYLAERTLPQESFTGDVVREANKRAHLRRVRESQVQRLDVLSPESWLRFNRRQKIDHLGVAKIISAPVFAERRVKGFGLEPDATAVGSLNLYFYRHDESFVGVDVAQVFTDALINRLADLSSRLVSDVYTLLTAVTAAHIWSLLCDQVQKGMPVFEAIKDALVRCFEADGATVFTRSEAGERGAGYECAATTGMSFRGEAIHPLSAWYTQAECQSSASEPHPIYHDRPLYNGLTKFLLSRGGHLIRMLDISDIREPVRIRRQVNGGKFERHDEVTGRRLGQFVYFKPEYRCCEALPNSEATHHRYLGVSIASPTGKNKPAEDFPLGAFRLTRSPSSRPFVPHDEEVLSYVARLCRDAFANRAEERHAQATWLKQLEIDYGVESLWRGEELKGREWTTWLAAVRRLLYTHQGYMTWNRVHVEGLLKDLLDVFASDGAILASLRFTYVGGGGQLLLRPYCVTSRWSNQAPDERLALPVPISHRNIGWDAIIHRAALVYERGAANERFTPIHRDSDQVRWGICLPFRLFASGHHVDGVLSLDFNKSRPDSWGKREIRWLYVILRQFAWLSSANHRPARKMADHLPSVHGDAMSVAEAAWDQFKKEICQAFAQSWRLPDGATGGLRGELQQLCLVNSDQPDQAIRSLHTHSIWALWRPNTFTDLVSVRVRPGHEFALYGVDIDRKTGIFRFPLFLGPCYVGYVEGVARMLILSSNSLLAKPAEDDPVTARQKAVYAAEFAELLNDLTDAWNSFANANHGPNSCWELKVERPTEIAPELWQAVVQWRYAKAAGTTEEKGTPQVNQKQKRKRNRTDGQK